MSWFLSDDSRVLKFVAGFLLLATLGGYYAWLCLGLEIGWRQCQADPDRWDGQTLIFPLWVVTGVDDATHYRISKVVKDVPVEGATEGLHEGDTVSVIGTYSREKVVVEQTVIEVHHLRKWKEGIGVAGMLAAIVGLPLCFRRRDGRIEERFGA